MNLLSLRYFLEVAESLSFSKASRNLHISQPGLSQQISTLEKQLGFQLFHRSTRKVTLTDQGKYLYKELTPSFRGIESTVNQLVETKMIPKTKIRIATVPSAASIYLPRFLNRMINEFPDFEFYLQETTSSQAVDLVKQQTYDIGFIRTPIHISEIISEGLNITEFQRHPLQLVVSSVHPLASKHKVHLYEVKDEFFIHYDSEQAPSLQFLLERACLTAGFSPKTLCTGSELLTISNLVASNLGVALMPKDMVNLIDSKKIIALDLDIPYNGELMSSISMVWRKENQRLKITDSIIQFLEA